MKVNNKWWITSLFALETTMPAEPKTHWLALKAQPQRERKSLTEGKSAVHPSAQPVQCSGCSAASFANKPLMLLG